MNDEWCMVNAECWMLNDEYYEYDAWWMMNDEYDEWWMMNDDE